MTKKSEVASKLGFKSSTEVAAGPCQLHYAKMGSNELVLLTRKDCDVLSIDRGVLSTNGQATCVFLDGLPFINFEQNPDGSLTNLSLYLPNKDGTTVDLIDRNVDGQWDIKLDHAQKRYFKWEGGGWVEPSRSQPGSASPARQPVPSDTNTSSAAFGR